MASQYDKIKSAQELVGEAEVHGLSTAMEDICRAQDIFGHSSIEELVESANGKSQDTFYMILFKVWNWRDATAFYNEHSNPDNIKELKSKISRQARTIEETTTSLRQINGGFINEQGKTATLKEQLAKADEEKKVLTDEIVKLKAKLYDLLIGEEDK